MRPSRSLRRFASRFVVALVLCVALSASGIAGAYWYVNDKWDAVANANISPAVFAKEARGKPANFLIIGSDTRSFVDNAVDAQHFGSANDQSGQRSDTMMIAHIDPATNTGMLVSIPRDLKVQVPGVGYTRINAAFNYGPQRVVETLQQDFDVPIHHYLEVDFAGFRDLVDAIGTVPIYFATPARDTYTGLSIALPGCYHLNGADALAYVRSRHYEYKTTSTDSWHEDPYSDLGRIQRQQYFLRTLSQVATTTAARHPFRVTDILDKALHTLTKDRNLALSDVRALVATLRDADPAVVPMITLPTLPSGDGATLVVDPAKDAPVLAALRSLTSNGPKKTSKPAASSNVSPSQVHVKVLNGSGVAHAAANALQALGSFGFHPVGQAADAGRTDLQTTEVHYAPGAQHEAELVAAYLGTGKVVAGGTTAGSDVTVVLGRDFRHVAKPAPTTPTTPASATPTTANGPKANPAQTPGVGPQPAVGC